jgi:hypothetical protein
MEIDSPRWNGQVGHIRIGPAEAPVMKVQSSRLPPTLARAMLIGMIVMLSARAAPLSIEIVGPAQPERQPSLRPGSGVLRVYSDTIKVTAARGGSAVEYPHSGFVLLSRDGQVLQHVENHNGTQSESPTPVVLAAGRYLVKARCAAYGELVVPVEIAAGMSTPVYLTTAGMPAALAASGGKIVRLPNGHAIGIGVATTR